MIKLHHHSVPAHDMDKSAQFFARIFGLTYKGVVRDAFAPVEVPESIRLDFENRTGFQSQNYAFEVSADEFDKIFSRVKAERVVYGSDRKSLTDMTVGQRRGHNTIYFRDLDGHVIRVTSV